MQALRDRKTRWAVARIRYSAADGACADGHLLYIKPALLGNEPPDVSSYHKMHLSFPHESTGDQWFDESQTESYRMLGQHTICEMCKEWRGGTLADLFDRASPSSRSISAHA